MDRPVQLLTRTLVGAAVVVLIQVLSGTKNYYVAGLVPLFPTFALISHYIVGTERTTAELKHTLVFSMLSLIPYGIYLVSLYLLVDRCKLVLSLVGATGLWFVAAGVLILVWRGVGG